MMMKILAAAIILVGCACLGRMFGAAYKKRVSQIVEFENVLTQLEFDIDFLNVTLADSFLKIERNCEKGVKDVVAYIRERILEDRCADMKKLWERALGLFRDELFLSDDDVGILLDFSKNLGSGDRFCEKNNIRHALSRLKVAENEAREVATRNEKMCRGLGLLAGVFIVIVLI